MQRDTRHQYELFNNLNDDWEVVDVDDNLEDNENVNMVNPVLLLNPVMNEIN